MKTMPHLLWVLVVLFWECSAVSREDISHLEGYWIIKEVRAHGEVFEPRGNAPLVDYYHFYDQSKGTKIKMSPTFDGTFLRSDDQARFVIDHVNDRFYLSYDNVLKPWKEEIITLNAQELILHHNEKTYHYKRFQKIIP